MRPASTIETQVANSDSGPPRIASHSGRRRISSPVWSASRHSEALKDPPMIAASAPIKRRAHWRPCTMRLHQSRTRRPIKARACSGQTAITEGTRARAWRPGPLRRAAQAVESPHEDQVLPAGEPIEEEQAVRNYADAALEGVAGGQIQDPHRAAGRSEHAGQHRDGGALAGAVLTEKAVKAAARHTQVDAVHGQLIAEAAGERVRLDGEAAHAAAGFFPKATGGACATLPERGNAACRAKASDSCTSCSGARSITAGCDLSSRCVWAFIEQNFGPHMAQNSAVLNASCGSVSSCFALAASGSRESANCWFQSNAYRARESASSRSRAPVRRRATSAACAAIL